MSGVVSLIQDGGFLLRWYSEGRALVVELSGDAESNVEEALGQALQSITPEVVRLGVVEVVVDIRKVAFLTSSCLKDFIRWLQSVQDLPAAQRYPVRFRVDYSVTWQRTSLPALKTFADKLVTLEPPLTS